MVAQAYIAWESYFLGELFFRVRIVVERFFLYVI